MTEDSPEVTSLSGKSNLGQTSGGLRTTRMRRGDPRRVGEGALGVQASLELVVVVGS